MLAPIASQSFITLLILATSAFAGLEIRINGVSNVVPGAYSRVLAHGALANELRIPLGYPVGIKIALKNASDVESSVIPVSLDPGWMPAVAVIVHPDGKETVASLDQPNIRMRGAFRAMGPQETVESVLYVYVDKASEIDGRTEYIFPSPGHYQLYVIYGIARTGQMEPSDSVQHPQTRGEAIVSRMLSGKSEDLVSNRISIHVEQPIAGWELLKRSGLVGAVRSGSLSKFVETDPTMSGLKIRKDIPWIEDLLGGATNR